MKKLTGKELQITLWKTIGDLRSKKIKVEHATAIASNAKEICRIEKMQLEYARIRGEKEISKDIFDAIQR